VFSFDTSSPKVNAYQIHEWLYEKVNLREDDIRVVQIDGPSRKVYVKFVTLEKMTNILQTSQSDIRFLHENGDTSMVKVEIAGMGIRRVRLSSLPLEISEQQIRNVLSTYGEVKQINEEIWSQNYRFKVKTGVRIIYMSITKHIPSHIKIDGYRANYLRRPADHML